MGGNGKQEEPQEEWQEPVACPSCGSDQVRIAEMQYEVPVFECERCGTRFEQQQ